MTPPFKCTHGRCSKKKFSPAPVVKKPGFSNCPVINIPLCSTARKQKLHSTSLSIAAAEDNKEAKNCLTTSSSPKTKHSVALAKAAVGAAKPAAPAAMSSVGAAMSGGGVAKHSVSLAKTTVGTAKPAVSLAKPSLGAAKTISPAAMSAVGAAMSGGGPAKRNYPFAKRISSHTKSRGRLANKIVGYFRSAKLSVSQHYAIAFGYSSFFKKLSNKGKYLLASSGSI